jgi:hypothetical protein
VPALESRPDVPLWLLPAFDAYCDLGRGASWSRIREWSNYYQIDLDWLFPVLRHAMHMVDEHLKATKAKRASTPNRKVDAAPK